MEISFRELDRGKCAPWWYAFSYCDYPRAFDVFYPIPVNLLVRYSRRFYWDFLKVFYWVGLIDVGEAEVFRWRDFYRIKSH